MFNLEKGFVLWLVFPLLWVMTSLLDTHMWQDLQQMRYFWKKKPIYETKEIWLKEEPCLLICHPDCVSVGIWKIKTPNGDALETRPMKANDCQQNKSLKIFHIIVFDAM